LFIDWVPAMKKNIIIRLPESIKRFSIRMVAIILILIIIISPYFLIIDFVTYSPLVLTVWLLSAAYYVFVQSRKR